MNERKDKAESGAAIVAAVVVVAVIVMRGDRGALDHLVWTHFVALLQLEVCG